MTFFVQERMSALELGIEYRGSVIGQADAERLLGLFESVLLAAPQTPIERGSLVVDRRRSRHSTVIRSESPTTPYWIGSSHMSRATPDAVAVTGADGFDPHLSRTRVDGERMADPSPRCVVGAGQRVVGVAVRRATDLIVGILAAQAAGAAYVPLDPAAPPTRTGSLQICGRTPI